MQWNNGTYSHEEIALPEAENDADLEDAIRQILEDRKKARRDKRIPNHVKAERSKEYNA